MKKILVLAVVLGLVIAGGTAGGLGLAAFKKTGAPSASTAASPAIPDAVAAVAPGPSSSLPTDSSPEPSVAEAPEPAAAQAPEPALASLEEAIVEPDPDYERALRRAGLSTRGWETDCSRHTVPFDEIRSGGPPRDGIPPIDNPKFTTPEDAADWLADLEPVIAFEENGEAKAYPLQVIIWHEIVNDDVGGVPVAVTFCPLCNSAIVFDRRLDGVVYDFGTSGNLRKSDLVMWDRQTESWWQQFTGEGIVGKLAGRQLTFLPSSLVSFADFREAHPDGQVLSRDTGFARRYGQNPYAGYDRVDNPPFLFAGDLDGRLLPKERIAAVSIDGVDAAFPFSVLEDERAVNYTVNGQDIAVFFTPGTASALDDRSIRESRDVGSTGVFDPNVDGRTLTFRADGDKIVDTETGSAWNVFGQAVKGPLAGTELKPIVHANHFWFAWGAFKPDTKIYQGVG